MALAQICICGHTKTDHATIMRKGKPKRTQCGWYECECNTFKLEKMMSMNQGFLQLPTYIDCNVKHVTHQKSYHLDDCNSSGVIADFARKEKKFNNGEYP